MSVDCYTVGSKRRGMCKYITETDSFTSTVTGENLNINHSFDCNDRYLVLVIFVKNNTFVKQQTTLVVYGATKSPELKVLI